MIDNEYYKSAGDIWWNPDQPLNMLQTVVNPGRVGYFSRLIKQELRLNPATMTALEVGCGGGILCEEIARLGFRTTGMDPSTQALDVACQHSKSSGLDITYAHGEGEKLPFPDANFDAVFCCDVLEHVRDLDKVISEISRVLKPGGYFFYDTINRTLVSKLIMIKVWQEWTPFRFMPGDLHVWEMFIKPKELEKHFESHGLANKDTVGLGPNVSPLTMLYRLNKRARGKISLRTLASGFKLKETSNKDMLYIGYAIKSGRTGSAPKS